MTTMLCTRSAQAFGSVDKRQLVWIEKAVELLYENPHSACLVLSGRNDLDRILGCRDRQIKGPLPQDELAKRRPDIIFTL